MHINPHPPLRDTLTNTQPKKTTQAEVELSQAQVKLGAVTEVLVEAVIVVEVGVNYFFVRVDWDVGGGCVIRN